LAVEQSANWSGLGFKELVQHLEIDEDHFFLENDTDASLLGERKFGLESEGDIGYLNYGTGLGGSIWKDEHLIRGLEPGFWNVNHEFELEHGGVLNPVEAFCSGTGIEMFLERKIEDIDNSDWQTGFSEVSEDNISPESFFEAVRGYDDFALDIYTEIKDINTQLLGGLTNNYGVDVFIFGGSVVYNNSFLIDYEYGDVSKEDSMQDPNIGEDKYLKHMDEETFLEDHILDWRPSPELKFSELGEYSVLYGAIATTLQNIETEL
jgi:predicted NBD/HSP70 family sugar kinase